LDSPGARYAGTDLILGFEKSKTDYGNLSALLPISEDRLGLEIMCDPGR
jgi:hypothetical protein